MITNTLDAEPTRLAAPPLVLVTGGKGGVGKTTVAANLGLALAHGGARSVLVDLDFGLANLDVVLGVTARRTVQHFFDDGVELERCLTQVDRGVRLLGAGSGSYRDGRPGPERRRRLTEALARLDADVLIGDGPAGIGDELLDFAASAQRVLVVTTPEPAAATDAFGVVKALDAYAADHGIEVPTPELFVNLAGHAGEAREVARRLAIACERFLARSPRFAGWMPRSGEVLRAGIEQRPFATGRPDSTAARSVTDLARRYLASLCLPKASGGRPGVAKASMGHGR